MFHFFITQSPELLALTIDSNRLRLVSISNDFEQDIFKEFTSEITRYMYPLPAINIEETRNFIIKSRASMQSCEELTLAILHTATAEFLGCCSLHGKGKVRTPELGVWIKKSAHGNHFGREAIQTLVNWSWDNIDLDYITYPVDRQNVSSSKIPESLGGKIVEESQDKTPTGKILDKVIYRIDRQK
jgi:[ribosomal protein S5]-alanine N-acetyltransferase